MESFFITVVSLFHLHQEAIQDANLTQFNFNFENDFIFQTDEYYTHSSKLEWIFFNTKKRYIYNFNIRQEMYTPSDHKKGYLSSTDMPYTGTLQLEVGFHKLQLNRLTSLDISLGYTGKYTYAKESMETIHSILPTNPIYIGWETQKETTPLFMFSLRDKYKYNLSKQKNFDVILNYGASLGNLRTSVFVGSQLRWSLDTLPKDYGFYSSFSSHINYKDITKKSYLYFVAGLEQRYVFLDMTLRNLEINHNQTIFSSGFVYKYNGFNIGLLLNKETKRFASQNEDSYGYGNILLGWSF